MTRPLRFCWAENRDLFLHSRNGQIFPRGQKRRGLQRGGINRCNHIYTRTAGFIRSNYLVGIFSSFSFVGWTETDWPTDRRTDILMSIMNCPWLSLGPCQISSSVHRKRRFSSFRNDTGQTDRRTNRRTRPLIEMRSRIEKLNVTFT